MNHIYKALITDLDGTAVALTSNGYDIDESTQDAVRHAIDAGKKLCCATGREWDLAKPVVKKLGFISPCIVEGGTRIIDPLTETTIWEKAMDDEASTHIIKIFKTTTSNGVIMHSANSSHLKLSNTTVLPNPLRYVYLLALTKKMQLKLAILSTQLIMRSHT
jgi:hydroxymethylpyrimidine pyrophosphatase-like HAD family hydrolase